MNDDMLHYVRRRGRIDGPWSLRKLQSEVAMRKLGRHDEVSTDRTNWTRAGDHDDLFPPVAEMVRRTTEVESQAEPPHQDDAVIQLEPAEEDPTPPRDRWYYNRGATPTGPLALPDLRVAIASGRCPRDALVWREGFSDWQPLESIPELRNSPPEARVVVVAEAMAPSTGPCKQTCVS